VAPLVTSRIGVAGVPAAFEELANPEAQAKVLVEPWR
jgi:threonine dehydrogenase-like Zn-dependent dehydrogenase